MRLGLGAALIVAAWGVMAGCSDDSGAASDTGATSNGAADAGAGDSGSTEDSGVADSGAGVDSGGVEDSGGADAGEDVVDNGLPPRPWAVDSPGFYNVGFRSLTASYTTIDDVERELRVVVWYPTLDTEGEDALYGGLLPRAGVFTDATVAPAEGGAPFPVMVFSHGNSGFAEQSYFLTEYFTTHGWVVVSLDHTGNTFDATGIDPAIFYLRPVDVSVVLDTVLALPEGDPLSGRLGDDIVMAGHSFGGYTTLLASGAGFAVDDLFALCDADVIDEDNCAHYREPEREAQLRMGFLDERIDVAIPMSPGATQLMGPGIGDITIPTLLLTAALDETTPNVTEGDPTWQALMAQGSVRVDFATAGHFTFSNACDAFPGLIDGDGCGDGFLPAEEAHAAINTFSLAFARFHLFGEAELEPLLNGEQEVSSDATISARP